jgi:hypothetical protein
MPSYETSPQRLELAGQTFWLWRGRLYPDYLNHGNAMQFIRHIAADYCNGVGLDIGADKWPMPGATPIRNDAGRNALCLPDVPDRSQDFIFSSHMLEHLKIDDAADAVELWATKLKPGGTMFLYLPHADMGLWQPESPWVGDGHKWMPTPRVVYGMMEQAGIEGIHGEFEHDAYWSWWIAGRREAAQ